MCLYSFNIYFLALIVLSTTYFRNLVYILLFSLLVIADFFFLCIDRLFHIVVYITVITIVSLVFGRCVYHCVSALRAVI